MEIPLNIIVTMATAVFSAAQLALINLNQIVEWVVTLSTHNLSS